MAATLQSKLNEISRKLDALRQTIEDLRQEKDLLEGENAELHADNLRLSKELKAAKTDIEFLTMSHRLAQNPDDVIMARRKIAGWIREIDRCIAQLKE